MSTRGRTKRRSRTAGNRWLRRSWALARRASSRLVRHTVVIFRAAPPAVRMVLAAGGLVLAWAAINWTYQVVRKPTELFFPVSGVLSKTPTETWREYAPLFRAHATRTISPELLAALAQVEGEGNPVARTYWQWHFSWNPFRLYRPASSAVGMYQITDGTFVVARHYCVHDHVVAEAGRWDDWHACWFNGLYTRIVPSHAVEMTSALLDVEVARVLADRRAPVTLTRRQDLAAVIHLCGAGGGEIFVRRGFSAGAERCGDQRVSSYLARVNELKQQFAVLASGGKALSVRAGPAQ